MQSDSAHAHSGPSYLTVLIMLLILTAVTVGVAQIKWSPVASVVVALSIASVKASLVALFFMHLKTEIRPLYVVVGFPLLLMAIMFAVVLSERF